MPGPGECLSEYRAGSQGVEVQLRGFYSKGPNATGPMRKGLICNVPDLEIYTPSPRSPIFPPMETEPPTEHLAVYRVGWGARNSSSLDWSGIPEIVTQHHWGRGVVLGMRVFGEVPWAVLGANPPAQPQSSNLPLTHHIHTFQGVSRFKNKQNKTKNLLTTALQINMSLGGPTVGGATMLIVPNLSGGRGIEK